MDFDYAGAKSAGYSDEEIAGFLAKQNNFDLAGAISSGYSYADVVPFLIGQPAPVEDQSFLRSVADVPLQIAKGATYGVRAITEAFGADNELSQTLRGVEDYVDSLLSAQSKADSAEIARIQKEAEDAGAWDQVKAAVRGISIAPIDFMANAVGTVIPAAAAGLAATFAAPVVGLGAATAATVAGVGTGAVMGAGIGKGAIYDAVKDEMLKQGLTEEQAESAADEAQSYSGENLDQIALSTALGAWAAKSGLEPALARMVSTKAAEGVAKKGILKGAVSGAVTEAIPEAAQGGQEQLAKNIALQREGVDVPTMRGVVGAGTLEGLAGGMAGAGVGGVTNRGVTEEGALTTAELEQVAPAEAAPVSTIDVTADVGDRDLTDEELAAVLDAGPVDLADEVEVEAAVAPEQAQAPELTEEEEMQMLAAEANAEKQAFDVELQTGEEAPVEIPTTVSPALFDALGVPKNAGVRKNSNIEGMSVSDPQVVTALEAATNDPKMPTTATRNINNLLKGNVPVVEAAPEAALVVEPAPVESPITVDGSAATFNTPSGTTTVKMDTAEQALETAAKLQVKAATAPEAAPVVESAAPQVKVKTNGLQAQGKQVTKPRKPRVQSGKTDEEKRATKNEQARSNKEQRTAATKALGVLNLTLDEWFAALGATTDAEKQAAATVIQGARDNALANAYRVRNNPVNKSRKKVLEVADEAINNAQIDPEERARAETTAKKSTAIVKAEGVTDEEADAEDPTFMDFETGRDAVEYIKEAGDSFQKILATRLAPLLRGVKVVVVEDPELDITDPDALAAFDGARGLYVDATKTIYLSAESGLNNTVVLHEALHAATVAKIEAYLNNAGKGLTDNEKKAIEEIMALMAAAQDRYVQRQQAGTLTPALERLFENGAFEDAREFVSYGITQPEMQEFLGSTPGTNIVTSIFTDFVNALRRMFNIPTNMSNAFLDLVAVTDVLLGEETTTVSSSAIVAAKKAAKEKAKKVTAEENKIEKSNKASEINDAAGKLMLLTRNSGENIGLLRAAFKAMDVAKVKAVLPVLTTTDITRWIGERLNNVKGINRLVQDMAAARNKDIRELAEKIPEWVAFNKASEAGGKLLGDVMHIATLLQVDPSAHPNVATALQQDEELNDLKAKAAEIGLSPRQKSARQGKVTQRTNQIKGVYQMWNKLGTYEKGKGHKIYSMAKKAYETTFERHHQILVDKVTNANVPADAKKKLLASITSNYQEAKKLKVYFPLMRYGNFWMRVGKGKAGEFYMFESATARNNFLRIRAEELQKAGDQRSITTMLEDGDLDIGDQLDKGRNQFVDSSQMLKGVFDLLDNTGMQDIEAVKDQVYQMYLMTLPDRDIRRRFTNRQGKTGFSADVIRNFITSQHTSANQLARLEFSEPIRRAIEQAEKELEGLGKDEGQEKLKLAAMIEEIKKRAMAEMTPSVPGEFDFDKLASVGNQVVFMYMLTAPKSALVQLTQLPIVGTSVLVGRGYGKANVFKTMARYSNIFRSLGTSKTDADGNVTTNFGEPSINDSGYVNNHPDPEYRKILKEFWEAGRDRDVYMATYAADMNSRAKSPTAAFDNPATKVMRGVVNFMSGAFHHTERMSREIMFMSTAELEFAKQKKAGATDAEAKAAAIEAGVDVTYESLFNYTQYEKPRIMKTPVGRISTQFLTFPLQMTSFLVRNGMGMIFAQPTPGARKEAATKFFGTLGMTYMFAGAVGMPFYSLMMGLAEGIRELMRPDMEDEDADALYDIDDNGNPIGKRNLDLWFREIFLPNTFGPGSSIADFLGLTESQAKLLQRSVELGPISAITDMNVGASTSLNNMWFQDKVPSEDLKSGFQQMAFNGVFGPLGSMGEQIMSGIDDANKGNFNRAIEKFSPAFLRGGFKAARLSEEGESTAGGFKLKEAEWYTTGKILAQTLNFSSTEVAEIQKANFLAKQVAVGIEKDRTKVLGLLDTAITKYNTNPTDARWESVEEALHGVRQYNYVNGFYPIETDTVNKSLKGRAETRAGAWQGLSVSPTMAPFIYPLVRSSRD
jgi:hypothetical protein